MNGAFGGFERVVEEQHDVFPRDGALVKCC
jgi:hypothetical protein